ncbi:MAG: DUF5662 family protein [Alphaproteobacteria bacterium]|nr:DUF5662 family protein [Alphaproteobacteria bacterium]
MKNFYISKRTEHVALVNSFAEKLGLHFPDHDKDKLHDPICSMMAPYVWKRYSPDSDAPPSTEQLADCELGIMNHKTTNPHHPEYWGDDIADMPEIALAEMCCDWCAANIQKLNAYGKFKTVIDFYESYALSTYKFTDVQKEFIQKTLKELS